MDDQSVQNNQNPSIPVSQDSFAPPPNLPMGENVSPPGSFVVQETQDPQNVFTAQPVDSSPVSQLSAPPQVTDPYAPSPLPPQEQLPPIETLQPANMSSAEAPPPKKKNNMLTALFVVLGLGLLATLVVLGIKFIPQILPGGAGTDKEVTLTWWGLWEDQTTMAPIIAKYQDTHPNVKINYIKQSPQDYRERLTNALAKGTGPDIFTFHNSWLPMFQDELSEVPASVMSVDTFNKDYYPVMGEDLERGTSLYGLPTGYDGIALYINQEIFTVQGKEAPKTWDELRETALSLTVKDENGIVKQSGVALGRTENVDHWQEIVGLMMLQNGVNLETPQGDNAKDALAYYTLFSSVDGVWDETLPNSTTAFAGGKLAMYFAPSWRAFEIKQQSPNLKFTVVPVPQLTKALPTDPDVNYATYWVSGVWKRSKEQKSAWEFTKYLSEESTLQDMYTASSKVRLFGQPYPKISMASLVSTDPTVSVFTKQALTAKSWYLASRTFDGPTGINSQINKYFEDAINAVNAGASAESVLATVAIGVNDVLANYGVVQKIAVPER